MYDICIERRRHRSAELATCEHRRFGHHFDDEHDGEKDVYFSELSIQRRIDIVVIHGKDGGVSRDDPCSSQYACHKWTQNRSRRIFGMDIDRRRYQSPPVETHCLQLSSECGSSKLAGQVLRHQILRLERDLRGLPPRLHLSFCQRMWS